MKKYILHIRGEDKVGIVSNVSKEITDLNGNIETSNMLTLGDEFNMLILFSINKENIDKLKGRLAKKNNLSVSINNTLDTKSFKNKNICIVTLKGADNEGIVHNFTKLLSDLNINIINMVTELRNAPITGQPLFFIKSKVAIPYDMNENKLKEILNKFEEQSNVAIKFTKANNK